MKRFPSIIALLALISLTIAAGAILQHRPPAPTFSLVTLSGERINKAALTGKVTLINFWATTCSTCLAEMPALVKTYQRFSPKGYETVAIAMSTDDEPKIRAYLRRTPLPFKIGLDADGALAKQFDDTFATPTSFLIDRKGRVVQKYIGRPDFDALNVLIEELLAE